MNCKTETPVNECVCIAMSEGILNNINKFSSVTMQNKKWPQVVCKVSYFYLRGNLITFKAKARTEIT